MSDSTYADWNAYIQEATKLSFYPSIHIQEAIDPSDSISKHSAVLRNKVAHLFNIACPNIEKLKKELDSRVELIHSDAYAGNTSNQELLIYHFGILFVTKGVDEHTYRNICMMLTNEELCLRFLFMMRNEKLNFYLHYNYAWYLSICNSSGFIFRAHISSKTAARLIYDMPCDKSFV